MAIRNGSRKPVKYTDSTTFINFTQFDFSKLVKRVEYTIILPFETKFEKEIKYNLQQQLQEQLQQEIQEYIEEEIQEEEKEMNTEIIDFEYDTVFRPK